MEPTILTPEWWTDTRNRAVQRRAIWHGILTRELTAGRIDHAEEAMRGMVRAAETMSRCEEYDGKEV